MTANELFKSFIDGAYARLDYTCDGVKTGDGERQVESVATCFKATAEVIGKAIEKGADLLICHEPIFATGETAEELQGFDRDKMKLILDGKLTVLRLHDYAHLSEPDFIHAGFLRAMGLEVVSEFPKYQMGISTYTLKNPITPAEIGRLTEEKLGSRYTRIVGNREKPVKNICLALGGIGLTQIRYLERPECDMVITGEADEVTSCSYVRDMNYFGTSKSLLLMGHFTAEYCGMILLAEYLSERGFKAEYIDCGEVY